MCLNILFMDFYVLYYIHLYRENARFNKASRQKCPWKGEMN